MSEAEDKRLEREIQKLRAKIEKLGTAIRATANPKKKEALKLERYNLTAQMGNLYLDQGALEEAGRMYESLPWKSHGEDRYYGITRRLVEEEEYEEARKLLEEGLSKYPKSFDLLNSMGLLFQRTHDHYEALKYFERALAIVDTNNIAISFNKALSLDCLGYHEEAFKVLTELLEKAPDDLGYLVEMGYCQLERKEPWAAIHYYRAAKEMGLESASVYGGLCCAYVEAGLRHEAYIIASEGVEKRPDVVGMYENLAAAAKDLGSLAEASEVIQKGFAIDPQNECLRDLEREVKRQLGSKEFIEKPINDLLASDMSDKEKLKTAKKYLIALEDEHPEYFIIGNVKRKPK